MHRHAALLDLESAFTYLHYRLTFLSKLVNFVNFCTHKHVYAEKHSQKLKSTALKQLLFDKNLISPF